MSQITEHFSNSETVTRYAERVERIVPAVRDLHRMARLLLAESVPDNGRILVLGAGGGLELKAFAEKHSNWRFDGVDPSAEMLQQAKVCLGDLATRVTLHKGYIDDAPEELFDGAVCLLTLHFLPREERLRTVKEIGRRLKPDAPLVTAHHSFPTMGEFKDKWLSRNAALIVDAGEPAIQVAENSKRMKEKLPVLAPEVDESILREAGFRDVELFYAAFTFKGWVCRKT